MTAHVWPIDNVSNTGRALRQTALAAGLAMADPARPLGGVSGVRPGTKSTIGSVTSTQWTVNPFGGTIDGEALAIAGPYAYSFETAQNGGVTAAGATARTDRLDVQISDPAEGDGSGTPGVQIVYTQGTTTTPPAAPGRTHPLFLINMPASGGGAPTLTWNATFTASAGSVVDFLTLAALRAWTTAKDGQLAYAEDENNLWINLPDAPTAGWYHVGGSPHSAGAFTPTGIYALGSPAPTVTQVGSRVYLDGMITSTAANFVAGTTYTLGTINAAYAPATNQIFACSSNGTALATVTVASSGTITVDFNTTFTTTSGAPLALSLAGCNWKMKGM